ncbi:predicted protein [Histoplasma capsulatum H143]|uniref:Uncharacterized protein n=1 Tax=Ajellomyces capsulatus (strain H143) TaxID=544712 RepID=C6HFG6_AJECH|nr:predicted protein [Histoplasma capsulatum H143]
MDGRGVTTFHIVIIDDYIIISFNLPRSARSPAPQATIAHKQRRLAETISPPKNEGLSTPRSKKPWKHEKLCSRFPIVPSSHRTFIPASLSYMQRVTSMAVNDTEILQAHARDGAWHKA